MYNFKIERVIAEISSTASTRKLLTLTAWNGNPAKLDLRVWRDTEDGRQPGRGVTLTEEEAAALLCGLADYLKA